MSLSVRMLFILLWKVTDAAINTTKLKNLPAVYDASGLVVTQSQVSEKDSIYHKIDNVFKYEC